MLVCASASDLEIPLIAWALGSATGLTSHPRGDRDPMHAHNPPCSRIVLRDEAGAYPRRLTPGHKLQLTVIEPEVAPAPHHLAQSQCCADSLDNCLAEHPLGPLLFRQGVEVRCGIRPRAKVLQVLTDAGKQTKYIELYREQDPEATVHMFKRYDTYMWMK